jgi:hypothetical protein
VALLRKLDDAGEEDQQELLRRAAGNFTRGTARR